MSSLDLNTDFPAQLRQRLLQPLPGRSAQRALAHELSYGRHFASPAEGAMLAATVIVLVRRSGKWYIPLTLRPETLPSHAGQICLPGGRLDDGETPAEAAVREVEEELRIRRTSLDLLGTLSPLYLYVSNFLVTPFVAWCPEMPELAAMIDPNPDEVEELVWLRVQELIDPGILGQAWHSRNAGVAVHFRAPHFSVEAHQVWGATAMMLGEFAAVIDPNWIGPRPPHTWPSR